MKNRMIITGTILLSMLSVVAVGQKKGSAQSGEAKVEFPSIPVSDANVNKPQNGATLSVSPPGFCWWRAGNFEKVYYILYIYDATGKEFFVSERTTDPVYVPAKVFPAGKYSWEVKVFDKATERLLDTRERWNFTIADGAYPLPMPDPAELLGQIPSSHPKLIFTKEDLPSLRVRLSGENKAQCEMIMQKAKEGLDKPLVETPVFYKYTDRKDFAQKRTDYRREYHSYGDTYLDAVMPMAFAYMITGEAEYGEAAKKHLLRLTELELSGGLEFFDSKFDEVVLQIADALPLSYDWAYDAFSPAERQTMETWMSAFADKLLLRMSASERDFYYKSGESHDGRVPPYLINFALVLSQKAEAAAWLRFGIEASLTVYPQWGTDDGGWAEGVEYAMTYSGRFIPPLQAIYRNTGFNLWERPFYRNFPYFLTYCISPVGEITPFGDSEDRGVMGAKSTAINSMLTFYADRNDDAQMRWWAGLFDDSDQSDLGMKTLVQDLMITGDVKPEKPASIEQDRAFTGVGWAALHSNITDPSGDLFVLFKSSPFGAESHSHLDQNSFTVMKGGKALAVPAGARYPQHGSPFHTRYTRQSIAHNTILVDGKGQLDRNSKANGRLFDFSTSPLIGYAAGDAHASYEGVERFDRHVVMLKPSVIVIIDDIELDEEKPVEWLLHGQEKFELDAAEQKLVSKRDDVSMTVRLIASQPVAFDQNDEWPIAPKEGYPMVTTKDPDNQWHFTGSLAAPSKGHRIVAIMTMDDEATAKVSGDRATVKYGKISATIDFSIDPAQSRIAEIEVKASNWKKETLIINRK